MVLLHQFTSVFKEPATAGYAVLLLGLWDVSKVAWHAKVRYSESLFSHQNQSMYVCVTSVYACGTSCRRDVSVAKAVLENVPFSSC